jgi:major type 1 subunit fimbrin (pilin)
VLSIFNVIKLIFYEIKWLLFYSRHVRNDFAEITGNRSLSQITLKDRKTMKRMLLATLIMSATAFTAAQAADTGNITFKGNVLASTCTVVTGGSSADFDIDFGTVSSEGISEPGKPMGNAEPIAFKLTGCPDTITKVSVRFVGIQDTSDPTLLGSGADGVGISFLESDGITPIDLNTDSKPVDITASGAKDANEGTADLKYFAQLKSSAGTIDPHPISATATYNLTYN